MPGTITGPRGVRLTAAELGPVPAAFVAATLHEYAMLLASPITVIGDVAPLMPIAPQDAMYPVIAAPPLLAGAVKVITTLLLPASAVLSVGAPGTARGITLAGDGGTLLPKLLVAVTEQL